MTKENSSRFGATDLFMLVAVLFWALNFSFIKMALREFFRQGFNGPRLTLASLLLLAFLWREEGGIFISFFGLYLTRSGYHWFERKKET